jgi:hypothetical protein
MPHGSILYIILSTLMASQKNGTNNPTILKLVWPTKKCNHIPKKKGIKFKKKKKKKKKKNSRLWIQINTPSRSINRHFKDFSKHAFM